MIITGVSGGADSVCLATVLKNLGYKLVIAHVNHNLRGDEAKRDENFVRSFAKSLNFPFECLSADIKKVSAENKISCETAGREVRYKFFTKLSLKYHTDCIAVAHNKNDNAETVLINFIRGAGLNGLKGISPSNSNVKRPLLDISRNEIENYLKDNNIDFVTDSTNFDDIYTRNIVRNKILKSMEDINPNIINTIDSNSKIIMSENNFIEKTTDVYAKRVLSYKDTVLLLDLNDSNIDECIKRRLIVKAIKTQLGDVKKITSDHIESILSLKSGKKFILGSRLTVRNNCGKLCFIANEEKVSFCYELIPGKIVFIKELGYGLYAEFTNSFKKESDSIFIDYDRINSPIFVRSRKIGDRFSPFGINGTQSVKDYFINSKIPYHLRDKIPIIASNDGIIGIFPERIDNKFTVSEGTEKILKITKVQGD